MTVNEYYQHYLQQLQTVYSLEEATIVASWIWESKAAVTRKDILHSPELILGAAQKAGLEHALTELLNHRPVQYVIGETWFYQLKIKVNEQVLIPRPETEELVHWIIGDHKNRQEKLSVLDIGTGSGCISIALKKNLPQFDISAIDISEFALSVANQNAHLNSTEINFIQLDLLDETTWQLLPCFDIIVSNPPYIPAKEKERMAKNVTSFEPPAALFVPDQSPLLFYEKIALFATTHLNANGKIYLETHEDFANETAGLFTKDFQQVEIKKDINDNERMIRVTQIPTPLQT